MKLITVAFSGLISYFTFGAMVHLSYYRTSCCYVLKKSAALSYIHVHQQSLLRKSKVESYHEMTGIGNHNDDICYGLSNVRISKKLNPWYLKLSHVCKKERKKTSCYIYIILSPSQLRPTPWAYEMVWIVFYNLYPTSILICCMPSEQ